jgi:hypothetical protein
MYDLDLWESYASGKASKDCCQRLMFDSNFLEAIEMLLSEGSNEDYDDTQSFCAC